LDDGRNLLSRNIAIKTASTIKNNTKWGTKKQPCSHPIHSPGIRPGHLVGCGGIVVAAVNAAMNTDDNLIVS